MRSVSRLSLVSVLSPASSQNKWLYNCSVSWVFLSFSIRSVARPLNGDVLDTVGVVE